MLFILQYKKHGDGKHQATLQAEMLGSNFCSLKTKPLSIIALSDIKFQVQVMLSTY
jgi:hypothetical protein